MAALSGGERLRATLACTLFAEPAPQLLLLDEPTNNLDLVSAGQLVQALNAVRSSSSVTTTGSWRRSVSIGSCTSRGVGLEDHRAAPLQPGP